MIPVLRLKNEGDRRQFEALFNALRLDPASVALAADDAAAGVQATLRDVAERGDAAVVESARRFDDPDFDASMIRVTQREMEEAAKKITPGQLAALRRAIAQVREYQTAMMPAEPPAVVRNGVWLGMRYTPLDSAGLYFPGGKASYPSTLIMLAGPAQVAGVERIVVCSPPSRYGRSDLVLAACRELELTEVFRAGGAAAIAAMAFGTQTIPRVDKIVGPGNRYVQLAKRALSGCVGVDGFLGPSEILVLADDSAAADCVAADLLAQAEHDPGSCFLLTTSEQVAQRVIDEIAVQTKTLRRHAAIERALRESSAIVVDPSMDNLIELGNRIAAEHVNIQTGDDEGVLRKLRHAGAVFLGKYSPVAAGDYIAGRAIVCQRIQRPDFRAGSACMSFLSAAASCGMKNADCRQMRKQSWNWLPRRSSTPTRRA